MWQRLKDRYAVSNTATRVQLQSKLSRMLYKNQSMQDFVDDFEEIFNRLSAMGSSVSEELQVAMFLSSFGDKNKSQFGSVIASLQTRQESLDWETATATLIQEYEDQQAHHGGSGSSRDIEHTHALYSTRVRPHRRSHRGSLSYKKCFSCNRRGHFARECPKKNASRDERRSRSEQQIPSGSGSSSANHTHLLHASAMLSVTDVPQKFILDSGASDHMVCNLNMLHNYEEIEPRPIMLGDQTTLYATHIWGGYLRIFSWKFIYAIHTSACTICTTASL